MRCMSSTNGIWGEGRILGCTYRGTRHWYVSNWTESSMTCWSYRRPRNLVTVETWILRIVALWVEFYLPQDLDMNLAYFFLFICLWQLQTSLSCIYNNLVVHQLSHSHKLTLSDVWPMSLTQDVRFKSAWNPVTCIACEICEKASLILMNQRCRR